MAKVIGLNKLRRYWPLYAFVVPSVFLVALLAYFPAVSAMYHAFFRWNGGSVEEFIGWQNFRQLFGWSPSLWLVLVAWIALLMLNLTGRQPRIKTGTSLGLLALAMGVGIWFRTAAPGAGKVLNLAAQDALTWYPRTLGFTVVGLLFSLVVRRPWARAIGGVLCVYGLLWLAYQSLMATGDRTLWHGFSVTFIFVVANLIKMIPSIITAVVIHRLVNQRWQYFYRVVFVVPMIVPSMVYLLLWKFFYDPTQGILNQLLNATGLIRILNALDAAFQWGVFHAGIPPSWLGDAALVIPALVFWGFPWVGIVGVLIYLAGLSSISPDVYEAAELDGIGWFKKFLLIELPLIMTQIRINLVLMIIGTLQDYGTIFVVLGDGGGPQGVALVPGLYMFRNAFVEGAAGKACAIGLILFAMILLLTEINTRYVRVDK